jgi:hypothetical protein
MRLNLMGTTERTKVGMFPLAGSVFHTEPASLLLFSCHLLISFYLRFSSSIRKLPHSMKPRQKGV